MVRAMKSFAIYLGRVLAFILAFTVDVKVRAEVIRINSYEGKVEVERAQKKPLILTKDLKELSSPADVETHKRSHFKALLGEAYIASGSRSFYTVENEFSFKVYNGLFYLKTGPKAPSTKIVTPHGDITLETGEIILTVSDNRTTLSVVADKAVLHDRASQNKLPLSSGCKGWIGGLKANGERNRSKALAINMDFTLETLELLGPYTGSELKTKYDDLLINWRKAVEMVAKRNQETVESDFRKLASYQKSVKKRRAKRRSEIQKLKKKFRDSFLVLPD